MILARARQHVVRAPGGSARVEGILRPHLRGFSWWHTTTTECQPGKHAVANRPPGVVFL